MKMKIMSVVAALGAFIALGFVGPAPANAITWYPYAVCASPGGNFGEPACVAYTGSYPSGYVRAESRSSYYTAIRLDTCSMTTTTICNNWVTVASADLHVTSTSGKAGFTPSVKASKYGYYRQCTKVFTYSSWQCIGTAGQVYLGD